MLTEITKDSLVDIVKNLLNNPEMSIGNYLLNGYRIQISKYKESGNDRYKRLYNKRRDNNLCIYCGKELDTEKRLCSKCDLKIDKKRWV